MKEKKIVNMSDWEVYLFENRYNLRGKADHHPRLGKGVYVNRTTELVSWELADDILIYTTQNTIYHCPLKYMTIHPYSNVIIDYKLELMNLAHHPGNELERLIGLTAIMSLQNDRDEKEGWISKETKKQLKKVNLDGGAILDKIRNLQQTGQQELADKEYCDNERLKELAMQYDNCVYMEVSNIELGDKLAYNIDGFHGVVEAKLHVGTFQDSVLYTQYPDKENSISFDLRYFPRGFGDWMETYVWSDNIEQVVLKNIADFDISFNGERIGIGETKVFGRKIS